MMIKILAVLSLLFVLIICVYSGDVCSPPIEKLQTDCTTFPELTTKSQISIEGNMTSFSTLSISPSVPSYFVENKIIFYLSDGVLYNLTYQVVGCPEIFSTTFQPQSFYYTVVDQPKCLYSFGTINIYNNVGALLVNGVNIINNAPSLQAGKYSIYDEGNSCVLYASVNSLTDSVPSYTLHHSMCGFDNGSITFTNPSQYDSIDLSDSNSQIVTPVSKGVYKNLPAGDYQITLQSSACDKEIVPIKIALLKSPIMIQLGNTVNFKDPANLQFSLPDPLINQTMGASLEWESNVVDNWSSYQGTFANQFSYFKLSYDTCSSSENFRAVYVKPNVEYTITHPSNGCLGNATINIKSDLTDLQVASHPLSISNGVLYAPFNQRIVITSATAGYSNVYINTQFTDPPNYVIQGNTDGKTCWYTFNVTITNMELFDSIYLISRTRVGDVKTSITGDTFYNVPMTYNVIYYVSKGCKDEQYLGIPGNQQSSVDAENTKINFEIIKYPSCLSTQATVNYTITTPTGVKLGPYQFTTSDSFQDVKSVPYNWCYVEIKYTLPNQVAKLGVDYDVFTNEDPACNYGEGPIDFGAIDGYTLMSVTINGKNAQANPSGLYSGIAGNNSVVTVWKNTDTNLFCYDSKTINLPAIETFEFKYTTSVVTNCENPNGEILILDYQEYSTIELSGQNAVDGLLTNLPSGSHDVYLVRGSCRFTKTIEVSSSDAGYQVTSTIFNPTCTENSDGDGVVILSVAKDGVNVANMQYNYQPTGTFESRVMYQGCLFKKNVTLTLEDPKIFVEPVYVSNTCTQYSVSKVVSSNPRVKIDTISGPTLIYYNQSEWYFAGNKNTQFTYTVKWNEACSASYQSSLSYPVQNRNPFKYTLTKSPTCNKLSYSLQIDNMQEFTNGGVLFNNYGANKEPVDGYFPHISPSSLLEFTVTNATSLCSGSAYITLESAEGYTNDQNIPVTIVNDVCKKSKGGLIVTDFDNVGHYYILSKNLYDQMSTNDYSVNDGTLSNLSTGNYYLLRYNRKNLLCRSAQLITIETNPPSITSVVSTTETDAAQGTVTVTLNFIPSAVTYQLSGLKSQSTNVFSNVPAGDYVLTVTIKDAACPIVLTKSVTVVNKSTPQPSSTPTTSSTSTEPSSESIEPSSSTKQSFNLTITLIVFILNIVFYYF